MGQRQVKRAAIWRRRRRRPWACWASLPAGVMAQEEQVAADCARSDDPNAMQMWERSGGNKGMVDQLVCDWNPPNPDKPINLSYIPHVEMVGKIAQGIATGDVPDLMGMDLIYAPAVRERRPARSTSPTMIKDWPELADGEPGPHDGRDVQRPALRRAAVRRRLGAVLQQGPVRAGRARPGQAARPAWRSSATYADKITALGDDVTGYYLPGNCAGCNIFTVGPLMWASGGDDRGRRRAATSRSSATASRRCSSGRATWSRPATSPTAPRRRPATPSPPVRLGQRSA